MEEKKQGLRFNEGKIRYDLLEPFAINELAKVFTAGAEKYAPNNWKETGMSWSKMVASLKRHLNAFERGEDFDETSCLHMAHVAWNAMALVSYYKIAPQFDDRDHGYLKHKKVSLDIDEVCADWIHAWAQKFNHPIPENWNFTYNIKEEFESLSKKEIEDFYLNLKPLVNPDSLGFNIHCYITARSIDNKITERWLQKNHFPTKPVYSVGLLGSKVDAFKQSGADYHIDDNYNNFIEMNNAGICCFLLTTPHNIKYEVGYKRIKDFDDFKSRFL